MSQSKYIEEVLKRFNIDGCKAIGTLFDVKSKMVNPRDKNMKVSSLNARCIIHSHNGELDICYHGHKG